MRTTVHSSTLPCVYTISTQRPQCSDRYHQGLPCIRCHMVQYQQNRLPPRLFHLLACSTSSTSLLCISHQTSAPTTSCTYSLAFSTRTLRPSLFLISVVNQSQVIFFSTRHTHFSAHATQSRRKVVSKVISSSWTVTTRDWFLGKPQMEFKASSMPFKMKLFAALAAVACLVGVWIVLLVYDGERRRKCHRSRWPLFRNLWMISSAAG
jgi:hypothetical protein